MRQTRTRWRLHVALFLGVGLAATGVGLVAYGTNVFRELELDTVDARFSIRGEQRPPENVEVVAIDDITFSSFNSRQENVRYPFPRRYFARVIDRLAADGAKVIAYDIQFTEQTDPENDNALVQSVADARNVVLATTEVDARGGTNVFGGDEVVRQVGARVGNGNFPLDPGGVIRRVAYSVDKLKSFSLVAAERATGKTIGKNDFPGGSTWIDYSGPALTIKPFSFSDVYYGRVPKGSFRDKIVVVGPSAVALQDIHPTSTDNAMSGAEIQASAINTALRDFPLRSVPGELTLALIILLGLLAPVASLRLTLLWTLALGVAAAAAYLVATQAAFEAGHVLSFIYPFGTLVASVVGALGAHYLLAAFERERVREVFSRFVPETVREQGMSDGFRMGIGLNSGPFMSGNVGSERRLEYAAIGDTTNTAARLEGMTKGQTHFLFFSDTTREALTNDVDDLVFVDEFEVRGRQGKVRIWSVEEASVEAFEAGR